MPPKKDPPPIAMPASMTLRTKRDPNPGAIDKKRVKRTTEEVQAANIQKKVQEASEVKTRKDAIAKTALLEATKAHEHEEGTKNAHHPPANTSTKVLRTRPKTSANDTDILPNTGQSNDLQFIRNSQNHSCLAEEVRDISSDSGEEYQPDDVAQSDSDDDEDEVLDLSDEDSTDKKRKPKKVKGDLRKEIAGAFSATTAINPSVAAAKPRDKRKVSDTQFVVGSLAFFSN